MDGKERGQKLEEAAVCEQTTRRTSSSVTFEKKTRWQIFSESGNRSAWVSVGALQRDVARWLEVLASFQPNEIEILSRGGGEGRVQFKILLLAGDAHV